MLTEYEFNKIIEALGHAERNAHPLNRSSWRAVARRAEEELPSLMSSGGGSCQCEDRPACGCDSDTYLTPYSTQIDLGDVAESWRERTERMENEREACSVCNTYFDDDDNEDDVVQGFHLDCAAYPS